jgi:hypothetical protein
MPSQTKQQHCSTAFISFVTIHVFNRFYVLGADIQGIMQNSFYPIHHGNEERVALVTLDSFAVLSSAPSMSDKYVSFWGGG